MYVMHPRRPQVFQYRQFAASEHSIQRPARLARRPGSSMLQKVIVLPNMHDSRQGGVPHKVWSIARGEGCGRRQHGVRHDDGNHVVQTVQPGQLSM